MSNDYNGITNATYYIQKHLSKIINYIVLLNYYTNNYWPTRRAVIFVLIFRSI